MGLRLFLPCNLYKKAAFLKGKYLAPIAHSKLERKIAEEDFSLSMSVLVSIFVDHSGDVERVGCVSVQSPAQP